MAIQHRRGNFADFDPFKMLPGEWNFPLDRGEGYYCISPGNVRRVATKEEIIEILETSQEAFDGLQQLLTELEDETVANGILNDISDLLVKTAQHDGKIDSLENRTTINETNIAENTTNIDNHILETAEDDVHGLASMTNTALLRTNQSGYFKDTKTGFMLQWNTVGIAAGQGYATVTYPVAFPNAAIKVYAVSNYISGDVDSMSTFMTTQINSGANVGKSCIVYARDKNGNIPEGYKQANWLAIGY